MKTIQMFSDTNMDIQRVKKSQHRQTHSNIERERLFQRQTYRERNTNCDSIEKIAEHVELLPNVKKRVLC